MSFVQYLETGGLLGSQVWHECCLMLQNPKFKSFTVSELLRKIQQGSKNSLSAPPTQTGIKAILEPVELVIGIGS